ncbi:RING-H2 finger protein ATL46-like [Silene latifolia]|uniref:RING-H2 finger protein ATL46-like n=1 Tax=Silene latifolia TaxID=37657 RepID=UPI003D783FCF
MSKLVTQLVKTGDILISPPPASQIPVLPSHSSVSSGSKISPTVLLIIVILAVIFFVSGILHLLVRFLVKRPSFYSSVSHPNRHSNSNNVNNSGSNNANSEALQRQLQQLFRLHDSGLDQPLIDALPVFYYKDIVGLKEPFDCAVCLCEFSEHDKLRLLPLCSHAFHISCIDTWLLSNSTCPLCRGSLLSHGLENQEFSLDYWRKLSFGRSINSDYDHGIIHSNHITTGQSFNFGNKPTIMEENASERRVFSVRLGKFKSLNNDESETTKEPERGREISSSSTIGSSSNRQLDARRCYSLGSYQYVLADSDLQVALSDEISASSGNISKATGSSENPLVDGDVDVEGKKISRRNKGESFSVSKIWLWSKKGKYQGSSDSNVVNNNGGPHPINVVLPLSTRDYVP